MKINKNIKLLTIMLPMLMITACTPKKGNEKTENEQNIPSINANNNITANEHVMPQDMEKLQTTNVVYFAFNKYDINPEYAQILDKHAEFLKNNATVKITVEGHTDEIGTPEYNIGLGERRANAVKMYLQSNGVNENQISIISYGEEKLVALGSDEESCAKNRRAVLVY
uniref:Peptidoglycan-associated lipoprotein n=1 Tax=Candidatus Aschnera chinzeii TaxID=1485666 RepID=A0AAT9G4H4_9ENTR|nr:MAG: peptidoglycan-associated lipoprotein Pal [Candidatus Aschnera chinzeii]